jgi:hypothetical protein
MENILVFSSLYPVNFYILQVDEKIKGSVKTGRINIDKKDNQALADRLGVLEQG